jgi:MFS family permease
MLFLVGAGMGMFMQILVIAVQNSVPPEHMGVGTASVTFVRTLGGAVGSAVLGAVLLLRERKSLPHYEHLYAGHPAVASAHAFVYGMDQCFLVTVPVTVLSFILSFLLREIRLRSSTVPSGSDVAGSDVPGTPELPGVAGLAEPSFG